MSPGPALGPKSAPDVGRYYAHIFARNSQRHRDRILNTGDDLDTCIKRKLFALPRRYRRMRFHRLMVFDRRRENDVNPVRRGCERALGVAANNDWLAVNQFTVSEGQHTRRPDVVLFANGLPRAVIELKNSADENATDTR